MRKWSLPLAFAALCALVAGVPVAYAAITCSLTTTCNAPDVVLLRLSSTTNAHAQLPSQSGYPQLVCCSGEPTLSTSCADTFAGFLRLSSTTNATVQQNTGLYPNLACFSVPEGNVNLAYQSGNCTGFDTTILSISSTTRAHAGGPSAYPLKVCGSVTAPALTLTFSTGTVSLGNLTPTVATFATTTITVDAVDIPSGYSLQVSRQNATATLVRAADTVTIPDFTAWDPSGSGNASIAPGSTLAFRVSTSTAEFNAAWWGSAIPQFGGFPPTSQTIHNCTSCVSGASTSSVSYRVEAPAAQKSGSYSGGITYTVLSNP